LLERVKDPFEYQVSSSPEGGERRRKRPEKGRFLPHPLRGGGRRGKGGGRGKKEKKVENRILYNTAEQRGSEARFLTSPWPEQGKKKRGT